ncbi:18894_t:CDS:2, partial [Acaulospora morrowiae]
ISNSASAYQNASSRDNINRPNNNITAINGVSDVEDATIGGHNGDSVNGVPDHDQDNEDVISRRSSVNGNSQRLLDSQSGLSIHLRLNSTSSPLINIPTTNTSTPASSSTGVNANNTSNSYANGHSVTGSMYEEISQMYPSQNAQFIPVPPQYYTPQFFPNNGQFLYDSQYRFGRSPQLLPSTQPIPVRSNVYPYPQIPVITQMHPPPHFHNPLIQTPPLSVRYLKPPSAGGDSGFSSRRSSFDQSRNFEYSPQRIHQQNKPKELDKALWVGNLPDSTTHEELKEFFADENMETHEAVVDAVEKYNEKEFKGIKLVCRPRKQTPADLKKSGSRSSLVSENTSPPTPSEAGSTESSSTRSRRSSVPPRQRIRQSSITSASTTSPISPSKPPSQNRYFILKSLTQDDLDISVQNGLWATQPHNEAPLNRAFKSAEHVYLIFSANKSGEFYGYAEMKSPISKETTETVQWTPIDEAALAASSSRPSSASEDSKVRVKKSQDDENEDCEDDCVPSRNWGTTFKIEWITVKKLPFIRTRHLRNPWNLNREVKISRDGTEVEPVVGERLLAEFHKEPLQAVSSPYMPLMLTQPLNIDNQNVGDAQERRTPLPSQNGTPSLQTP